MDISKPHEPDPQDEQIVIKIMYGNKKFFLDIKSSNHDPVYMAQVFFSAGMSIVLAHKLDMHKITDFLSNTFDKHITFMKGVIYEHNSNQRETN